MNPKEQLENIRRQLRQGLPVTIAQKQWIIDQCIRYGSRVQLEARLAAVREGLRTTGLVVQS